MIQSKEVLFSYQDRNERLSHATTTQYDLIVIGGGVTGAGIALDASLRGIKTLLLEKNDFASGTSSKSTKLIHGGLRYLKQLEFGLVRETGLERAVAFKNIPHLVHPETMLLPIVKEGTFSKLSASIAISVYDWMAKVPKIHRKKNLNKVQTLQKEPLLHQDLLKSAIAYSEYRTDDARLTIELIKAAKREGAEAFNYVEVDSFLMKGNKVSGVQCHDLILGAKKSFIATQVVSAAGPWVDDLRDEDHSLKGKSLHLTKGVHIVLDKKTLPIHRSVYFDAFDGRMLFAIPRGKVTYVGTSDTNYNGDLDRILCTAEDVNYILKAVNHMFEVPHIDTKDVLSSWAGLRPLIHEDGKSPSELSRKEEIFVSNSGLISIAGGKLTGYRKMAERTVDLVQKQNSDFSKKKINTKKHQIHADSFANYEEFVNFYQQMYADYKQHGLSLSKSWYLVSTYGKYGINILNTALQYENLKLKQALIRAEIEYAIQFEACMKPEDYFIRRSGKLYFDTKNLIENYQFIFDEFTRVFKWDDDSKSKINTRCRQLIQDSTVFK